MKFKVGDKVKILRNSCGSNLEIGSIGTVVAIDDDGIKSWIYVNGKRTGHIYFPEEIELITNSDTKEKPYMRKKYILLKETSGLKKGAIVEEKCDDGTQDFTLITPESDKFPNGTDWNIPRKSVTDNPKWYQEVTVMYVSKDKLEKVKKLLKKIK